MNKKFLILLVTIILVTGVVSISGCTSSVSCPQCGSSNVEDVRIYTNLTTDKQMQVCNCNNCGYNFEVEKS